MIDPAGRVQGLVDTLTVAALDEIRAERPRLLDLHRRLTQVLRQGD